MKRIFTLCTLCAIAGNTAVFAIEENGTPDSTLSAPSTKLSGKLLRKVIYSLDNKMQSRKNATAKVEVMTSQDIENQNSPVLAALMNQISGVTVQQSGAYGDKASFRIRGNDRVKVLIDGMKANDLNDNKFYLQDFMSDDIERIEVVKGPSGNMAGTQASGGLVGLFTKRGHGEPSLKLQSDVGGYGTFRERASFSGSTEKTDYYLSTTFFKTDGGAKIENSSGKLTRMKNDDYKNFNIVGNFGHKLLDGKAEVRNITRLSNSKKGSGYSWGELDNNNYNTNFNITNASIFDYTPNEWYDSSTRLGIYSNTYNFYQLEDNFGPDYNPSKFSYRGSRVNLVSQHNFAYKDFNKFSIGYNMEYEKYNNNYSDPWSLEKLWGSSFQHDFYANDTINIKDILFLKGGARFSNHSLYGSFVSPNASAALVLPTFKLNGAYSKFRGSWGKSANTPTFNQRYTAATWQLPNPDLKMERFEGWDVGFEQSFFNEKLMFDVGYFNNKYKDYINWQDGPNWWDPGIYANMDNARLNGYETGVSWQPNEKFRTSFNYTYTHSEDLATGKPLPGVPNNRVNITTYYTPSERLTLYTSVAGSTDRVYSAYDSKRTGGFVDVSLGGKMKVYENERAKVFLTAQIFNLLNQKISMYRGMYHPGISCLMGLNLEFKTKGKFL